MAPVVGRSWSFAAYLAGSCAALAALRGALLGLGRSDRLGGDAAARAAMLAIAGSPWAWAGALAVLLALYATAPRYLDGVACMQVSSSRRVLLLLLLLDTPFQ